MYISKEELKQVSYVLNLVQGLLFNELDVICDDDYREKTENVLKSIGDTINIVEKRLYNKHDSL